MKRMLFLLLALLLLCGCAARPAAQPEPEQPQETQEPEAQSEPEAQEPPAGEPEGWEEEWPREYPIANFRLADGAITQAGELNRYRYTQLGGAERYHDIVSQYLFRCLGDDLRAEEDSPHDGYANWFITGENGGASVSGSSITGRFSYSMQPGFDRILQASESEITDPAAMERAARDFAALFAEITGELELLGSEEQEAYYHDERTNEMKDITVPVLVFTFRSKEHSELSLDIQEGLSVPVCCGSSDSADLAFHCFTATVWPDGTVVAADNNITAAGFEEAGTTRMIGESDLPVLAEFFTSYAENDTLVVESIRANSFSVYFGSAEIEPTVTMEYRFESDPDSLQTTEFVLPGLFDP